ncbi:MAG: hypothetical protein HOP06_09970 [Methylotenera sp.]|nr:hypothetical protein [Methylotenera sp.]
MASTQFFATPQDQFKLREYIDSLELIIYPENSNMLGQWKQKNKDELGGYISFLKMNDLHPYKHPKDKFFKKMISPGKDPLLSWAESFLMDYHGENYIIQGSISYNNFLYKNIREKEHKKANAYFGKLQRWIRKNWPPFEERGFAIGDEAKDLILTKGYLARGIPPNVEIQYIKI